MSLSGEAPSIAPPVLSLLKRCNSILQTSQVHASIIHKGLEQDHFLISHLLSLSATSLQYSLFIFHRLLTPSTVIYNVLFKAFTKAECCTNRAISLFNLMRCSPIASPDKFTFPSLIKACCNSKVVGESLHCSAIRYGVYNNVYVGSSLVNFYGKSKEITAARKVFDEISEKNVVSWTAIVVGYVSIGDLKNAAKLLEEMPEKNLVTWNSIITCLVKDGQLAGARNLFNNMPVRDTVSFTVMINGYAMSGDMHTARSLFDQCKDKDIVAWTTLINGYVKNKQPDEALEIFRQMESLGIEPDNHLIVSLMSACSTAGNVAASESIESYLKTASIDLTLPFVVASLIGMFAKCGKMDKAKLIFESIKERDLVVYCSMIEGYSLHGLAHHAINLFDKMLEELVPDEVAFTVILMACNRGGLVDDAFKYFAMLKETYSLDPKPCHYLCIIDLLCRKGRLKEAYDLLDVLPVEAHASSWGALLGGCKRFDEVEMAEVVADKLIKAQPRDADNYVGLSNIYAISERWCDVYSVREKMKADNLQKLDGRSWIECEIQGVGA